MLKMFNNKLINNYENILNGNWDFNNYYNLIIKIFIYLIYEHSNQNMYLRDKIEIIEIK